MPASGKDLWRLPHYRSWRMTTSPCLRALCILLRAAAYDRQGREAPGSYGGGEDHHRVFIVDSSSPRCSLLTSQLSCFLSAVGSPSDDEILMVCRLSRSGGAGRGLRQARPEGGDVMEHQRRPLHGRRHGQHRHRQHPQLQPGHQMRSLHRRQHLRMPHHQAENIRLGRGRSHTRRAAEPHRLTALTNLNLAQNYLTGPLPSFMGELTNMEYMSLGINALSGPVPKELGNLTNLIVLSFGSNNFSGSLPSELGNLAKLEQLYIDSAGVSGPLPSSLSKLTKMKQLWASDNDFTGQIPDYIGSWSSLTDLRFQGNSFQGPIPATLSNLGLLASLRIGDILNGSSSSLTFLNNLTSLNTLILRNCRISDKLVSTDFSKFTSLNLLDLSFNNITGELPQTLLNLNSLTFLKPSKLNRIITKKDFPYNQLSGSVPSWAKDSQLNLVTNNFVADSSSNSVLPMGWGCLQRGTPRFLGSPKSSSFAVDCGSMRSVSGSDNSVYEPDDASLGPASFYVTGGPTWGVSNVGRFMDSRNGSYIIYSSHQFQNTLDTELFRNARMSPSSLRYFGIGLENGNYTVTLQFAEFDFPDGQSWKSTGRRVFDIYIQGVHKEQNFDIRKEAGRKSYTAVRKQYIVPVTKNFLEIHLFWAGKGTCCIPSQGLWACDLEATRPDKVECLCV
ncbi:probable LRR receptor-like serine/threonine-protein kinase At1g56140 [Lolium rigidum]|uniref:probable LRR receptor-like serine/threonine-protein kinase At1g56140 n=1 Tax=Lolium rigidum TaxID=89674 RepID=UPI001F5D9E09|nr:probable LRR receptor-like serine/threonine-protein kinase At1g56140 [Lolium rigidum]